MKQKLDTQGEQFSVGINNFDSTKLNDLLSPFQNLIEDDFNDFLGPGSSSRFVIYDDQIIDSTFTESDENAICRVDVRGEQELMGDAPGDIAKIPVLWAGATDFDLWRQYGYRAGSTYNKPFLKDAISQCAPYALFLLARAKKDIVRGSITLYGNEYYQLGDVVYINSRDMLYYVVGIKQSFSYESGSYTTRLDLRYGHPLGEYIPTPFDIIGKHLIKNMTSFNKILVSRQTSSTKTGIHIGFVIFNNESSSDEQKAMLSGANATRNLLALKRALLNAKAAVGFNNSKETYPKVEVRGWIKSESDANKTTTRMDAVVKWLTYPVGIHIKDDKFESLEANFVINNLIDNNITNKLEPFVEPMVYPPEKDLDPKERFRGPSEEVLNASPTADPYNIIEIVLLLQE